MKRFGPGWGPHIAMPMFDDPADPGTPKPGEKDAAYWEAEAKRAFVARDLAKGEIKKLQEQGLVLTPEQKDKLAALEAEAAKAEEERAVKKGEFEKLRQTLTEKHQKELEERESKISTLSQKFQNTVITAEFGSATDLFGGHAEAKTVLDVAMARAVLGQYVHVEDDEKDPRGYRIVVKFDGETIVDGKGNPAPFADAISEVISKLPNKAHILRGSGKSGSGSSGGGDHSGRPADLEALTKAAARGDQKSIKALRERRAGGSIVKGQAWEKHA